MLETHFNKKLTEFLQDLNTKKNLVIALSGGSDSMALIHLAQAYVKKHPNLKLWAIHINHGISSQALKWEYHCKKWCDFFNIEIKIFRTKVHRGAGLEERAREARYKIFAENLTSQDLLLMGHHQDDAIETLMLNMFRASGTRGLASIPKSRSFAGILLFRPFLTCPKSSILNYLAKHKLSWVDDDSNTDTSILRNFLRLEALPKIEQKFPNLKQNLSTSIKIAEETESLLADLAQEDLKKLEFNTKEQYLNWQLFCEFSRSRQKNILRHIQKIYKFPPINTPMLDAFTNLAKTKTQDMGIFSWSNIELRLFDNRLYFNTKDYFAPLSIKEAQYWNGASALLGIKNEFLPRLPIGDYQISARRTGAKIFYKGMNRKVKKLLQEKKIAPWVREQLPFIWQKNELICVGNIIIADNFNKCSGT